MSNIEQLRAKIQDIILLGTAFDSADLEDRVNEAFDAFESQPLTVIAPPLEWGEWSGNEDLHIRWMESRCGNYTIGHDLQKGIIEPFHQAGVLFTLGAKVTYLDTKGTESEAKAACQSHRQAEVNQALEGCNVIPYRDPQGLVDALRQISEVLKRFCQTGKLGELQQSVIDAELILKAWEEGK